MRIENSCKYCILSRSIVGLFVLIFSSIVQAQEYSEFSVLGTSQALCKPGIQTGEELQSYFANNRETVEQVLDHAKWQGDSEDLFNAIANGEFTQGTYAKGTTFEWTSLKNKGIGETLPKRVWAGEAAFEGFELNLTSQCQVHKMIIPSACCNLSLATSTEVTTPKPQINIESDNENVSICSDSGGEVVLTKSDGSTENLLLGSNHCWLGTLEPGSIMASVTNTDSCGSADAAASHVVTAAPVPVPVVAAAAEVDPPAPVVDQPSRGFIPYIGIFAGSETRERFEPMWQKDYEDSADLLGISVGLLKPLSGSLSLFTQFGHIERDGVNTNYLYPNNTLFWDIGIDKNIGKSGFIGAGIGFWHIADKDYDETSLLIHGGSMIADSNAQWFVEGRIFEDSANSNNLVTAGIRYLFNR
jgi:hypothetical protein